MSTVNHAALTLPEGPALGQRRRWTTGRILGLVVLVAIFCGSQVALLIHMQRWEARRTQMNVQRELTTSIVTEAMKDVAAVDQKEPEIPHMFVTTPSRTSEWSITARKFYPRDGNRQGPDRLKVSGGNGEYSLKPIKIEIHDALVEFPVLERLEHAYNARGWTYEVVTTSSDKPAQ